jgi:hypothetical protein
MREDEDFLGEPDDMTGLFWQRAELTAGTPPRPAKSYVTVPLAWLRKALPVARSVERLAVLLLLYRRCLIRRSRTVTLPNGDLEELGLSRYAKYRTLNWLQEEGIAEVQARNGRAVQVTLHSDWFP